MKYRTLAYGLLLAGLFAVTAALFAQGAVAFSNLFSTSSLQWTTDIKVNPVPTATIAGHDNGSLAVSPVNANFIMASYNAEDLGRDSGYAASTDGGSTWQAGRHTGPWGALNLAPDGDTYALFDRSGVVYNTSRASDGSQNAGYFVLTSTNGITWSNALTIAVDDFNNIDRRQSFAVIDQRPGGQYAGSIYVFWSYADFANSEPPRIVMRYSRDGGHTWSNDIFVSDEADAFRPWAAVAPDGSIYAAFTQEDDVEPLTSQKLFLDRSTDGGATWGTDNLITGAPITPVGGVFKNNEIALESGDSCQPMETFQRAFITTSRTNPNVVYTVWNDGRWDTAIAGCFVGGKHSDIAFSRSADAGATWTTPVRLNDDTMGNGRDQFEPAINVGHDGTLGVIWYDRRYDTNPYLYNATYTQSRDGGLT